MASTCTDLIMIVIAVVALSAVCATKEAGSGVRRVPYICTTVGPMGAAKGSISRRGNSIGYVPGSRCHGRAERCDYLGACRPDYRIVHRAPSTICSCLHADWLFPI